MHGKYAQYVFPHNNKANIDWAHTMCHALYSATI